MRLEICLWIARGNQLEAIQLSDVRLVVEVVGNSKPVLGKLDCLLAARLWAEKHDSVRLAEVYDMDCLNARGGRVDYLVVSNVQPSVGISLLVWNELAVKVLVEAPDENIPWLDDLHYLQDVVAVHGKRLWVICQNGNPVEG